MMLMPVLVLTLALPQCWEWLQLQEVQAQGGWADAERGLPLVLGASCGGQEPPAQFTCRARQSQQQHMVGAASAGCDVLSNNLQAAIGGSVLRVC
jgi:hypothetical protein